MTRYFSPLVLCLAALSLLAVTGCRKDAARVETRQPPLATYRQQEPQKLEPVDIPPVVKERKGDPDKLDKAPDNK